MAVEEHRRRHDDEPLSPIESRVLFLKKYGFLGLMVLMFPFVEPFITNYFSEVTVNKFSNIVKRQIYDCSSKDNKVSEDTMLAIARLAVAKQSIHKVEEIKRILNRYDTMIGNEKRIGIAIKNELVRQSAIYVNFLNTLAPHPSIGYAGTYIANNFEMDSFVEQVISIATNPNCGDINNKGNDIMQFMLAVQADFFSKMKKDMSK
jgi:hypothetical protein